ncbi:hypothetical protein EKD16_18765 [Streptomonospora litoralis]|uniref:DUF5753 domain-containing protein n=2 Tax=Streptomonospora litoralis TaxID=2498135 RepID=A0A4P6Q494_9ACTN|nr:hypothetical protein EKD16_18765 [Streptomonospora litoralis]
MHYTMVGKLERLDRVPQRVQAEELDTALETGGTLTRLWQELNNQRFVPDWFKDALLLEQRATAIRAYESIRVPGLLQTEDYARILVSERQITSPPERLEEIVKTRTKRLGLVRANKPLLWFVINETALLNLVGDETVMRDQIRHILGLVDSNAIRVQVLPRLRSSLGLCEPFRVMALNATQSVGYVENMLGGEVVDAPEQVTELTTVFGLLASDSLPFPESVALLKKVNGDRYGDVEEE